MPEKHQVYSAQVEAILMESQFEHVQRNPEHQQVKDGHFRVVRMVDEAQMRHEDALFAESGAAQQLSFLKPLVETEICAVEMNATTN